MEPYRDYHKALADGYQIFLPNVPQAIYHFSRRDYAMAARWQFDPCIYRPRCCIQKRPDGGYKLVGVMYTDRVDATKDELNDRIPLSIARWHQHINFCKAPRPEKAAYLRPDAKFGLRGSITTEAACDAAGGIFYPHVFGWMVHVYPYEKIRRKFGRLTTTTVTIIWITPRCRGCRCSNAQAICRATLCSPLSRSPIIPTCLQGNAVSLRGPCRRERPNRQRETIPS